MSKKIKREDLFGIQLTEQQKDRLTTAFRDFFEDETGETLGIFQAEACVTFFIENMAPHAYNLGLSHSREWLKTQLESIDLDFDMLYRQTK
jgi:uncharacterized protein (DUF2164 family)